MLRSRASQVALGVKILLANAGEVRDTGSIPGSGRSPGGENDIHSIIPAQRIPRTEETGGLQPIGWLKIWTRMKSDIAHIPYDQI